MYRYKPHLLTPDDVHRAHFRAETERSNVVLTIVPKLTPRSTVPPTRVFTSLKLKVMTLTEEAPRGISKVISHWGEGEVGSNNWGEEGTQYQA